MIDIPPRIAFGRSKIALASIMSDLNEPPVQRVQVENSMTGKDTVVMACRVDPNEIDQTQFDYFEVVAVSPHMIPASPVEDVYEDEDGKSWSFGARPGPSSFLERRLTWGTSVFERPTFGRRILLVNYEIDLDERDVNRAKAAIRRALGSPTAVWQGRSFEGYCFTDNAPPESIMQPFYEFLDRDEIEDYLLVQPTDLVLTDKSGLSRLKDWMEVDYRQRPRTQHRGPSRNHRKAEVH